MRVTLDIEDNKAKELIQFLRTLDFVSVKNNEGYDLSIEQQNLLEERETHYDSSQEKTTGWEEIKDAI